MTPNIARSIICKVKNMSYSERIKKLSVSDWDFINAMDHILAIYPAWEKITEHQTNRFINIQNKTCIE